MITIHGTLYSSKNHTQILRNRNTGKSFVSKPKKTKQAESGLLLQLNANKKEWGRMESSHTDYPLRVQFKIYRKTKQRFDYSNICQSIFDLMVKAGYLPDDSADYFIPVFEPYEVDPKNPRVEITIL